MASMHMPAQSAAAAELANAIYNTPGGDEAGTLVDGIMDNVSPEVIATCLMTRASNNDSHASAMTLIAELDCAASAQDEALPNTENKAANQQSNQPSAGSSRRSKDNHAKVNSAALGDKMFGRRNETLKAAITRSLHHRCASHEHNAAGGNARPSQRAPIPCSCKDLPPQNAYALP
jgi:hypothetical protein